MRKLKVVTPQHVFNRLDNFENIGDKQKARIFEVLEKPYIFSYDVIAATPLNRLLFLVKQILNALFFVTYRPLKWLIIGDFNISITTKFGRFLYFEKRYI